LAQYNAVVHEQLKKATRWILAEFQTFQAIQLLY
jgi:hypothetical protein